MTIHECPGVVQPTDNLESKIQVVEESEQVVTEESVAPRFSPEEIAERRQRERDRIEAAKAQRRRMKINLPNPNEKIG